MDITSPSIPKLIKTEGLLIYESEAVQPVFISDTLSAISAGYFERPITGFGNVDCKDFDVLVVDTPPGITDMHLDLCFYEASCVLVSTPHAIAVSDVKRQCSFLKKGNFTVLGIIENMKGVVCRCGHRNEVACGNVEKFCQDMNIPYLGFLDFDMKIAIGCDRGDFVENDTLKRIADDIIARL
ncbi:Cytosolic Fe-S cluster assembly factor NUBP1 [Dictyocoela roeselum]|nr:Cytosolic Fe-S cluster assembly factor NUBP1 [Dictyocoela roeselum]